MAMPEVGIRPDIGDQLEVFLFTNLAAIVSPHPEILLTPSFQAALTSALNDVGVRHQIDLPSDLKNILDVYVVTNATKIVTDQNSGSPDIPR